MKLANRLTYFIKQRQPTFFRQRKQQPKSDSASQLSNKAAEGGTEGGPRTDAPNMQAKIDPQNNSYFAKRQGEKTAFRMHEGLFGKRSQQQRGGRPTHGAQIIAQRPKSIVYSNDLSKLIRVAELPTHLFALHRKYCEEFTHFNYEHLFIKLSFSFRHRDVIAKFMQRKDAAAESFLSSSSKSSKIEQKQSFLTKEQMISHQQWRDLIQQIMRKLRQIKDIQVFNQYLPTFISIQNGFNFIPSEIYQYVLARNAMADFNLFRTAHISNIIHFMKYKNGIQQTSEDQVPHWNEDEMVKVKTFTQRLAEQIINNPENYTKDDFINVFIVVNKRKRRMNIFSVDLLNKSQGSIMRYLDELSFFNIFTYMKIYTFFHPTPNRKLLERLKNSLQQKCHKEVNRYYLLMVLYNIKERELIFKNIRVLGTIEQFINLKADTLALEVAQVLSRYMNELKPVQVNQFLERCFQNQIRDINILTVISDEISKLCWQFSLQIIGKALFKLHLLGCRSQILMNSVIKEYVRRYKQQMMMLKQESFAPPDQSDSVPISLNFKQIHHQQCLIMAIWVLIELYGNNLNKFTHLKGLLSIYPSKTQSMDPLIVELVSNINHKLQKSAFLPKIMIQFIPNTFPEGRLSQLYRHNFSKNEVQLLMWQEAQFTNKFTANYNFEAKKYLPERWSSISTYKQEDYIRFFLKPSNESNPQSCYFDEKTNLSAQFLQKRNRTIKKLSESSNYSQFLSRTAKNETSQNVLQKII